MKVTHWLEQVKSSLAMCAAMLFLSCHAQAQMEVRLKDLVEIQGVRSNQLFGYGLVVGLKGTGDKTQTVFTSQSLTNMLDKLGIVPSKISKFGLSSSNTEMKVKNVAAVLVTAELPPFIKEGSRIDATVSSIGDCKSLEGGTLVMTSMQGADGRIYAVAQGPVTVGGLTGSQTGGLSHPTVGVIPQGALVENEVDSVFVKNHKILLALIEPDFTVSNRIVNVINQTFASCAQASDSGSVELEIPRDFTDNPISFISRIEQLTVEGDLPAKVVINERTGTIVTGENVVIAPVAISHGTLTVTIKAKEVPATDTAETPQKVMMLGHSVNIGQVARNLNSLGATPADLIAIFQTMKRAGALRAKLEFM
ncbi:MAG: flagellar basal body P-ring protein FlgI [Candidatus Aureabacteria bacterium]|nr:flagellar basal body P-ring protein FlgI [Candidatus Auribacterota bacterium]